MDTKVSIVIPVYNVEKYIRECIDSIVSQTLQEIEIILVDDGSNDSSGRILDEYGIKDNRIKVIHMQNRGVSESRNKGLNYCNGEYIYIMDSDDYLEPDAIKVMYNNALETGADVVITDHYTFREDLQQLPHHFFSREFVTEDREIIDELQNMTLYLTYSPYPTVENTGLGIAAPWTKLLKRTLVEDNKLKFDPYVEGIFDDGLFTLSVFQFAKKVSYVSYLAYHYRILQSSLIHRFNPRRIEIDKKVFHRIYDFYKEFHRNIYFLQAFYARIILYMVTSFSVYYFNKNYIGSAHQNFKEFKLMINSEPYQTAIRKVELNKLKRAQKYPTILLRAKLYFITWLVFPVAMKIRDLIHKIFK